MPYFYENTTTVIMHSLHRILLLVLKVLLLQFIIEYCTFTTVLRTPLLQIIMEYCTVLLYLEHHCYNSSWNTVLYFCTSTTSDSLQYFSDIQFIFSSTLSRPGPSIIKSRNSSNYLDTSFQICHPYGYVPQYDKFLIIFYYIFMSAPLYFVQVII